MTCFLYAKIFTSYIVQGLTSASLVSTGVSVDCERGSDQARTPPGGAQGGIYSSHKDFTRV